MQEPTSTWTTSSATSFTGIDPSFSRTGLCEIRFDTRDIILKSYSVGIEYKDFHGIYKAAYQQVTQICKDISEDTIVIMEEPIPQANFSSGLFSLDSLVANQLADKLKYTIHPTYLRQVIGKNRTKTDSVNLAKEIINKYKTLDFTVDLPSRLNHDCAEALIITLRLLLEEEKLYDSIQELVPNIKNSRIKKWEI